ncbi:C-C motif chemokine 15 [Rousettus aegyptiacus]|uniref:C-C motif chemokine n=1 Tax=Rousettus aegyptiacus TaxID=9407 RepID=A0A7J8G5L7_ROUAE|nr:C-C motif chemokine 15 [Rousettus aegyptiacus]KAF6455178.1 C-C motif chemokine ligand 23 [Rousettus aegyptiacus]
MKIATAALSFLVLAAALGSPTHGYDAYEPRGPGFQRPADCCLSYAQKIPCKFMEYYFETSSGCSQPGVIFVTKRGRLVCANPGDREVQECIMKLKPKT